ncbi:aldo/keto reductase [Paucilactobacillus suebicus]|uniref:Aldo keto reductase n=1 Tax=Paucilactobacillus suebicus DSM 5007 = KCTC 3549 TaxID=1423807 RepID=A0A0R1W109_9LACO|nr:aldo/keto reductase [Paucilactobacillus suebicus]KRM11415.1 aldo keto reductase [Paucilactobacillus suebicus DSM 5007 = KCTC 3549]
MTKELANFPKIALGTWSWGTGDIGGDQVFGNHLGEAELKSVVSTAMKAGLNLWDTAYAYGRGSSETILGNLLKDYDRKDYLLSTKFTPVRAVDFDYKPEAMLDSSLDRLHTDYIDMYWIHNSDDVERWTPEMIPLLKSGKIKHVGVSNHSLAQIKRANEILGKEGFRVSAVQNHYSLLFRDSEETGVLDYCKQNDIAFFPYMILEQGALTGKYNTKHPLPKGSRRAATYDPILPKLEQLTDTMTEIGKKYDNATVSDIATAWAINKGSLPIIGVTKPDYIAGNVHAMNIQLSDDEIKELEQLADATGINAKASWEKPIK